MRWLAPVFVMFAVLTSPNGRVIYLAKEAVSAIVEPIHGECEKDAHAKIYTSSVWFCVAEDVSDARNKIEGSNGHAETK